MTTKATTLAQEIVSVIEGNFRDWLMPGEYAEAVELVQKLVEKRDSDHRTMRSLLIRIHSARVGMNEAAVLAALDDVDRFFREENTN